MKLTRPKKAKGKAKGKGKGRPKGKPKAKAKPVAVGKAKVVAVKTEKGKYSNKGKSVHVQRSIQTVLARTGFPKGSGKPGSKSFKYERDADIAKKQAAAYAWLRKIGA